MGKKREEESSPPNLAGEKPKEDYRPSRVPLADMLVMSNLQQQLEILELKRMLAERELRQVTEEVRARNQLGPEDRIDPQTLEILRK